MKRLKFNNQRIFSNFNPNMESKMKRVRAKEILMIDKTALKEKNKTYTKKQKYR